MKFYTTIFLIFSASFSFSQRDTLDNNTDTTAIDDRKYDSNVLHEIFTSEFNDIANLGTDVGTKRYFASLTNENNKFSLGVNIALKKTKSTSPKISCIMGLGIESNSKNEFATIFKNGKIQNEITGILKFGHIGNGIITIRPNEKKAYVAARKYLESKEDQQVVKTNKILEGLGYKENGKSRSNIKYNYDKKAEFITKNRLYKRLWDWYWNMSLGIPLSIKEYKISPLASDLNFTTKKQYQYRITGEIGTYWKYNSKNRRISKLYLSARAQLNNTNNIERDDIVSKDFLSIVNQSSSNIAIINKEDVYVGDYKEITVFAISGEAICFPFQEFVGVSASAEADFGDKSYLNWKIGIPFVLRDKEQKPIVNFEFQWKEVRKNNFLGIKAGFVLGKFIG